MMETARISETSVDIDLTSLQYMPEDSELQNIFCILQFLYHYKVRGAPKVTVPRGPGGSYAALVIGIDLCETQFELFSNY
jgi:hypothetical protein